MTGSIDIARLTPMLNGLRRPAIKQAWSALAERADKESWAAARCLATLAGHEIAEPAPSPPRAPSRRGAAAARHDASCLRQRPRVGGKPLARDVRPHRRLVQRLQVARRTRMQTQERRTTAKRRDAKDLGALPRPVNQTQTRIASPEVLP
jgi:hypothetical protein